MKRCVLSDDPLPISTELNIFGKASEKGFRAVAFIRSIYPAKVGFLISKTRIAPFKFITLPRMELCAAVLDVWLYNLLQNEPNITFD